MSRTLAVATLLAVFCTAASSQNSSNTPTLSQETQACLDCHKTVTPGIVADWMSSRHAKTTPAEALRLPALERRVSAVQIPDPLQNVAVGCFECHGLNGSAHTDHFDHFGYGINVVVSPKDCRTCHPTEASQFAGSKKERALDNLERNPVYHSLVATVTGVKEVKNGGLYFSDPTQTTLGKTCYACHGTDVAVVGTRVISTELGDIEVPKLSNWPNQGVGRWNPDGSKGSCTACHPRHTFSIEVARKPYTCSQCHLQPDVPAWDVYIESKHGNIFSAQEREQDWNAVPWTIGEDLRVPTCATCHDALLVNSDGDVIAERSHDFGARLWVRIFGLIYSHPQPKEGATFKIKNKDGLPLPTTFDDVPASEYLIDAATQAQRRATMQKVCTSCHASSWVEGFFAQLDTTNIETDKMVLAATQLLKEAWQKKLADPKNPFDEKLEQKWVEQWLFYANSTRYAAAMVGPDYAAFKNGWWYMTKTVQELQEAVNRK